jgi:hypothetical protein
MSILGNAIMTIKLARQRRAKRYVAEVLSGMSDVTLKSLGKTRQDLERV